MFWNKKETPKEQTKSNDCRGVVYSSRELRRETRHTRSIVYDKLYDTEKSKLLSQTQDNRFLFITEKGNYFSCDNYIFVETNVVVDVCEIIYTDIRPETAEYAKENVGRYAPDKYIELFGEVEEA